MLDVDRIVIGGGVGIKLGRRLIDPITAALAERERTSPFLASIGMSRRVDRSRRRGSRSVRSVPIGRRAGRDRGSGRNVAMTTGVAELRLAAVRSLTPDGTASRHSTS